MDSYYDPDLKMMKVIPSGIRSDRKPDYPVLPSGITVDLPSESVDCTQLWFSLLDQPVVRTEPQAVVKIAESEPTKIATKMPKIGMDFYRPYFIFWYKRAHSRHVRNIKETTVNELIIKSSFISVDHRKDKSVGAPLVYETLIQDASGDADVIRRFDTYLSCWLFHRNLVNKCRKFVLENMVQSLFVEDVYGFNL